MFTSYSTCSYSEASFWMNTETILNKKKKKKKSVSEYMCLFWDMAKYCFLAGNKNTPFNSLLSAATRGGEMFGV